MNDLEFQNMLIFSSAFVVSLIFCTWASLSLGNLLSSLLM